MNPDYHFHTDESVLTLKGHPVPGVSLDGSGVYDPNRVHAAPWRLKEWDFYQISDHRLCLQLTIGHVSYAGNCNIMLFDHGAQRHLFTKDIIIPLPFRSLGMPTDARADSLLKVEKDGALLRFETQNLVRHLTAKAEGLTAEVVLKPTIDPSISICFPFHKPNEFYFNEKINLLEAEVALSLDGQRFEFDPETTFGLMDWGRGVWPFRHEWIWSSLSARLNGRLFGFNLGRGFGDTSQMRGTENVIYYGDQVIKLNRMDITHQADFMQPWQLRSDDGGFEATLFPQYDRATCTKMLFVNNTCHQMFGRFVGNFMDLSGDRVEFNNVIGFAEHAYNQW